LVKEARLGNNHTFRETLLSYFSSEADLIKIEDKLPLLTIFVPTLPEGTFSAQTWDVESQIPDVAIRLRGTNEIPIVKATGEQMILEADLIPGYPVIVVKNNERMISERQYGYQFSAATRTLKNDSGLSYKFVDDIFDRYLPKKDQKFSQERVSLPDQKIQDAYKIYKNADGWQRDYIYYGITPNNPNGQFSYDFKEYISSFTVMGDALLVYKKMAEQSGDPFIKSGPKSSGWSDGFFEIRCATIIQAKNGIGPEIDSRFIAKGADFFDVKYKVCRRGIWPFRYDYYQVESVKARLVLTNMPLVNWDLESYAPTFRIDVEEADNTEIIRRTITQTNEFATNFDIQGTILKIGLKFGGSMKKTLTSDVEISTTLDSDPLGQVTVNFADKILLGTFMTRYLVREYDNDIFSICIEPRKVH